MEGDPADQDLYDRLNRKLEAVGQLHLLQFWSQLSSRQRQSLDRQLQEIDFRQIDQLVAQEQASIDWADLATRAESPPAFRLSDQQPRFSRQEAIERAEATLSAGKVGAILVAGGQGSRLGFPHPKGIYRIGPVSDRTLFQMHLEQLSAVSETFGQPIPLYLMTSPATHEETVSFLASNDNFGVASDQLQVFCQGTMPAVDDNGKVLLADKDQVFLSPDGHGGMLAAFHRNGCLADAQRRGLEQLFYFQVDNPLVRVCDPELLGYHLLSESQMSTQVVAKSDPLEKVGNVVAVDGRLMIIEYSDLPDDAARLTDDQGELKLWAGSIAIHVFDVSFLDQCGSSDNIEESLPLHTARKKVPYLDTNGNRVEPRQPNAIKFERFIFDLMPKAENAIVVEGAEEEVFAPLKNASGAAKDTPETTRRAIIDRARRWLRQAGVSVKGDVAVEISPFYALNARQLAQRVPENLTIEKDTYLVPQ